MHFRVLHEALTCSQLDISIVAGYEGLGSIGSDVFLCFHQEKSLFDILLDHPLEYDFDSEDMKSILSWGSSYEVSQGNQDSQGFFCFVSQSAYSVLCVPLSDLFGSMHVLCRQTKLVRWALSLSFDILDLVYLVPFKVLVVSIVWT